MKKITKVLVSMVSLLTIAGNVLTVSSCSDNSSSLVDDVEMVAYDGSAVTVTFYHTMGAALREILNDCIPNFNAMYPNIKIEHGTYGDYPALRNQISNEMSANKAPSLAYCYPDHVALYNKANKVLPLDEWINSTDTVTKATGATETMGFTQEQLNDFVPAYYNEGKIYGDNTMYTLPMLKSTEVLYYNKDYFEENKLTVPTTWTEMEDLCKQILEIEKSKATGDTVLCYPLGYDSEANWFITMTEQMGTPYTSTVAGERFIFNTEENRAFVEQARDWYKKGYVITEELNGGSYTSDLFTETAADKVKCYMCIGSSAGASYQCPDPMEDKSYPFAVGVAPIPQVDSTNAKVISQGPSICLFKKSNPQEVAAAWLFAKFLTTNIELQARLSMNNGYTCAIQSVQNNDIYKEFLEDADGNAGLQATVIKQTYAQQDNYFVSPAFFGSSAARDEVGELMQICMSGNPSGSQTVAAFIESKFEASIKALQKRYDK